MNFCSVILTLCTMLLFLRISRSVGISKTTSISTISNSDKPSQPESHISDILSSEDAKERERDHLLGALIRAHVKRHRDSTRGQLQHHLRNLIESHDLQDERMSLDGADGAVREGAEARSRRKRVVSKVSLPELCAYQNRKNPQRRLLCRYI